MTKKKKDERPLTRAAAADCIHRRNPCGGFAATHGAACAYRDGNPATAHLSLGHWCGNVCAGCAKRHSTAEFCDEPLCIETPLPLEAST